MAVAIASSASNKGYSSTSDDLSFTVTKPTGLAVGDILFAIWNQNGGTRTTPSDWTVLTTTAGTDNADMKCYYKIADSSDVAASNFTFVLTGGAEKVSMVYLLRITGGSLTQPVATYSVNPTKVVDTKTPSISNAISPFINCLLVMATTTFAAEGIAVASIASQAIATSNPTWTEIFDEQYSPSGVYSLNVSISSAIRPENTSTGNTSFTITFGGTVGNLSANALLIAFPINKNFSISETVTTTELKYLDQETNINDSVTTTESYSNIISRLWTNISKPVTTWINKNKN